MLPDAWRQDHEAALRAAADETALPASLIDDLVTESRRTSRLRARAMGSAALEAAVEAIGRTGERT